MELALSFRCRKIVTIAFCPSQDSTRELKEKIDRNIHQKIVAGTWNENVTRSGTIVTKQTQYSRDRLGLFGQKYHKEGQQYINGDYIIAFCLFIINKKRWNVILKKKVMCYF